MQTLSGTHQTLGEFVKERRNSLRLTLRDLGKKSGLDPSYISRIERGEYSNPTVTALDGLAKGLKVPYSELDRIARGLPVDQADEDAKVAELMDLFRQVPPERQEAALRMLRSLAE